ncbi:hypothetical protein F4774DRAFT_389895 [Daldinia eschscholtzii]|nr:hypothetical protein F4774DRAFT_389895 [Daldinia eschscholtzii]
MHYVFCIFQWAMGYIMVGTLGNKLHVPPTRMSYLRLVCMCYVCGLCGLKINRLPDLLQRRSSTILG